MEPGGSLELAGGAILIIRRLIAPLAVALTVSCAGQVLAQGAFPAPLPGQAAGAASDPAFPPVNGTSAVVGAPPSSSFPVNGAAPLAGGGFQRPQGPPPGAGGEDCMKEFMPLREDAEKRGKLIKAASDRHATPQEACGLIKNFTAAETRMIKYVETHSSKCGIPPQVLDQLRGGHKNSESMQQKVCSAAENGGGARGPAGPTLSDVLGSAAALPEATKTKKGGSTFDTLNGNVLTR
jgi:hypothetical protein